MKYLNLCWKKWFYSYTYQEFTKSDLCKFKTQHVYIIIIAINHSFATSMIINKGFFNTIRKVILKELTLVEMNTVSGAGLKNIIEGTSKNFGADIIDTLVGGTIGLLTFSAMGALQGAVSGSSGGGLLGVGSIAAGVGALWSSIHGGIWGTFMGSYHGAAWANGVSEASWQSVIDGTGGGYKTK